MTLQIALQHASLAVLYNIKLPNIKQITSTAVGLRVYTFDIFPSVYLSAEKTFSLVRCLAFMQTPGATLKVTTDH